MPEAEGPLTLKKGLAAAAKATATVSDTKQTAKTRMEPAIAINAKGENVNGEGR